MNDTQIKDIVTSGIDHIRSGRVLLIIPDTTRTAPVGRMFKLVHSILSERGVYMDVMVALGTHQPLSRETMLRHLGLTKESYNDRYLSVQLFNHHWDDPNALAEIGTIPSDTIREITGGLMAEDVAITLNRRILDYDHLLILGPVFPHEVAGFSGGAKYLFPGISGPEIIDFFHWLGATITNMKTIGIADNPVRRILDAAADFVPIPVSAISMVIDKGDLAGLYAGGLRESWEQAVKDSLRLHVVYKPKLFKRVLACAPLMYDDLWTGGKCMYKCEPVVADGGELIIYAPHITSFSYTHGHILEETGYHVRDYYLHQPERFTHIPPAVKAVSTYLKGSGTYENGVEKPRIRVTLATGIPRELCEKAGVGYLDPATIDFNDWRNREDEGIFFVEKAGETLYLLDT